MPKFLERKLKERYGKDSSIPWKIMNKIGAMRGNKTTAKGRKMKKKHTAHEQMKALSLPSKKGN